VIAGLEDLNLQPAVFIIVHHETARYTMVKNNTEKQCVEGSLKDQFCSCKTKIDLERSKWARMGHGKTLSGRNDAGEEDT
jgi:hypothetical protein